MSTQPSEPSNGINLYGAGSIDMDSGATQQVVTQLTNVAQDVDATHQRVEAIFQEVEAAMSNGAASGNPVDVAYNKQVTAGLEQGRAVLPDATAALYGTARRGGKAVAQYVQADQAVAHGLRASRSHYSH